MAAPQRAVTLNRPNMVSVGTIVFLSQELMFFAGLFDVLRVEGELRG
jgi:cytochrome c oxidase subunit 3